MRMMEARESTPHRTAWARRWLGSTGPLLVAGLGFVSIGCPEEEPIKRTPPPYVKRTEPQPVYAQSQEDGQDRSQEVQRVCKRKAAIELPRCWQEEHDRTQNRKLAVYLNVSMIISPDGRANSVQVTNPTPNLSQLERCVVEAAQGWQYPSGESATPVQCIFFLQSSM